MKRYGPTRSLLNHVDMDWATTDVNDVSDDYASVAVQQVAKLVLGAMDKIDNVAFGKEGMTAKEKSHYYYTIIMGKIPYRIRCKLEEKEIAQAIALAAKAYRGN